MFDPSLYFKMTPILVFIVVLMPLSIDQNICLMPRVAGRKHQSIYVCCWMTICGWRCSVVVSALASINAVNRHWAWLLLGWVTACRQINRLGI